MHSLSSSIVDRSLFRTDEIPTVCYHQGFSAQQIEVIAEAHSSHPPFSFQSQRSRQRWDSGRNLGRRHQRKRAPRRATGNLEIAFPAKVHCLRHRVAGQRIDLVGHCGIRGIAHIICGRRRGIRRFSEHASAVPEQDGISQAVGIKIHSTRGPGWITARPSPHPRRQISGAIIIQPGLIVPFLAGITVTFSAHFRQMLPSDIGRFTVGCELLVRNNPRGGGVVRFEDGRAEMVAKLEAGELFQNQAVVRRRCLCFHQGNARLSVRDVQHLPSLDETGSVADEEQFETTHIDALLDAAATGDDLSASLARGIVLVLCAIGIAAAALSCAPMSWPRSFQSICGKCARLSKLPFASCARLAPSLGQPAWLRLIRLLVAS